MVFNEATRCGSERMLELNRASSKAIRCICIYLKIEFYARSLGLLAPQSFYSSKAIEVSYDPHQNEWNVAVGVQLWSWLCYRGTKSAC